MLHETDAPDDQQPEREPDDERHEGGRHAQVQDPESPGATIDTDDPAEPNEPA